MKDQNSSPIIEGEKNHFSRKLFLLLLMGAVITVITYGPKKSIDFVKNQMSFALTPEEKWGVKVFLKAEDFRGVMEDIHVIDKMSNEQLVVLLETDRYGEKDDYVAIIALRCLIEKTHFHPSHLEKSLYGRLRKVIEDNIDMNRHAAETLVPDKIENLDKFFDSYLAGSKITLSMALRHELDQIRD